MAAISRNSRACMVCSVVLTANQFLRDGCPNCEAVLNIRGSVEALQDCTSQVFEGLIALKNPESSWVAKWQRLTHYVPGIYATKVVGTLPTEIIEGLEDNGVQYIPRDGTNVEETSAPA